MNPAISVARVLYVHVLYVGATVCNPAALYMCSVVAAAIHFRFLVARRVSVRFRATYSFDVHASHAVKSVCVVD